MTNPRRVERLWLVMVVAMLLTLGENPKIIDKLTVLYEALTDEKPGFVEVEQGAVKVAKN